MFNINSAIHQLRLDDLIITHGKFLPMNEPPNVQGYQWQIIPIDRMWPNGRLQPMTVHLQFFGQHHSTNYYDP
jgi:hypothetical protein